MERMLCGAALASFVASQQRSLLAGGQFSLQPTPLLLRNFAPPQGVLMADNNSMPGVVGVCFVLPTNRGRYVGCVRVQQDEFYSTPRLTNHDAMSEARKIAVMLYEERVITGYV